jgi:hypothetical protein
MALDIPTVGGGFGGTGAGALGDLDASFPASADPYAVGGGFGGGTSGLDGGALQESKSKPQYILKIQPSGSGDSGDDEANGEGVEGGEAEPAAPVIGSNDGIAFQAMLEMSATENSNLPEEPIEQGSFANYNRTIESKVLTCRLGLQGEPSEIQSTLDKLTELKEGTDKITFILPMASYENLMLESFDYRRDDHTGHNVLIVDLRLKEIREIENQKTTSSVTEPEPPPVSAADAADGSCASEVDCGEVQSYSPSSSDESAAENSSSSEGDTTLLYDVIGGKL